MLGQAGTDDFKGNDQHITEEYLHSYDEGQLFVRRIQGIYWLNYLARK